MINETLHLSYTTWRCASVKLILVQCIQGEITYSVQTQLLHMRLVTEFIHMLNNMTDATCWAGSYPSRALEITMFLGYMLLCFHFLVVLYVDFCSYLFTFCFLYLQWLGTAIFFHIWVWLTLLEFIACLSLWWVIFCYSVPPVHVVENISALTDASKDYFNI